jgi:hypothetical protein
LKPPILLDVPESFETERLLIRSPLPGDGPELHAAVTESLERLVPWMPWPKEHKTVEDSEESARRARVAERAGFLLEGELRNNEVGTDGEPSDTLIFALTPGHRTPPTS